MDELQEPVEWYNQIEIADKADPGVISFIPLTPPYVTLFDGPEYCGMEIPEDMVGAQDVKKFKARKFVDLIMSGKTPKEAAKELQVSLRSFENREEVQAEIKKTIEKWHFPAEVRKMFSRAKLMEIASTQDVTDPKGAKVALEAVKTMGTDDEVGFLNPKTPAPAPNQTALPEPLMKLLGVGGAEDIKDGEEEKKDDDESS